MTFGGPDLSLSLRNQLQLQERSPCAFSAPSPVLP